MKFSGLSRTYPGSYRHLSSTYEVGVLEAVDIGQRRLSSDEVFWTIVTTNIEG